MAPRPSRGWIVSPESGPDEDPLVGDGGSTDEVGWEAPTRPDHPIAPAEQRNKRRERRTPGRDEPPPPSEAN